MAFGMAHISRRVDSANHYFRLRTPANVLPRGGMNRRILLQLPEFMYSPPIITTATIGAEIREF